MSNLTFQTSTLYTMTQQFSLSIAEPEAPTINLHCYTIPASLSHRTAPHHTTPPSNTLPQPPPPPSPGGTTHIQQTSVPQTSRSSKCLFAQTGGWPRRLLARHCATACLYGSQVDPGMEPRYVRRLQFRQSRKLRKIKHTFLSSF